eukprot:CAMPEP_0177646926 /NCGR_PEP_ID=MMETSP0447-20121125/10028_1 /TAXON_ID=0 /ORGANISM="Stygamoeba regulata, Strain BSH-02190019" /LENGTH=777 /DNA_ID=CAMNT_0019149479 /DNA_START=63 /DNA_END=2396 /DNA_ORIENTATION=+
MEDGSSKDRVIRLLCEVENITDAIQDKMRMRDNQRRQISINSKMPKTLTETLLAPHRVLVKEGWVKAFLPSVFNQKTNYLYLYNDLFLFAKRNDKKEKGEAEVVASVVLIGTVDVCSSTVEMNDLRITLQLKKGKSVVIRAPDEDDLMAWHDEIQTLITGTGSLVRKQSAPKPAADEHTPVTSCSPPAPSPHAPTTAPPFPAPTATPASPAPTPVVRLDGALSNFSKHQQQGDQAGRVFVLPALPPELDDFFGNFTKCEESQCKTAMKFVRSQAPAVHHRPALAKATTVPNMLAPSTPSACGPKSTPEPPRRHDHPGQLLHRSLSNRLAPSAPSTAAEAHAYSAPLEQPQPLYTDACQAASEQDSGAHDRATARPRPRPPGGSRIGAAPHPMSPAPPALPRASSPRASAASSPPGRGGAPATSALPALLASPALPSSCATSPCPQSSQRAASPRTPAMSSPPGRGGGAPASPALSASPPRMSHPVPLSSYGRQAAPPQPAAGKASAGAAKFAPPHPQAGKTPGRASPSSPISPRAPRAENLPTPSPPGADKARKPPGPGMPRAAALQGSKSYHETPTGTENARHELVDKLISEVTSLQKEVATLTALHMEEVHKCRALEQQLDRMYATKTYSRPTSAEITAPTSYVGSPQFHQVALTRIREMIIPAIPDALRASRCLVREGVVREVTLAGAIPRTVFLLDNRIILTEEQTPVRYLLKMNVQLHCDDEPIRVDDMPLSPLQFKLVLEEGRDVLMECLTEDGKKEWVHDIRHAVALAHL